jgi:hypothetical protein
MRTFDQFSAIPACVVSLVLAVCMSIPCAAFAFRNPNEDPQKSIARMQEISAISADAPAADAAGERVPGRGRAAAVLMSGEISSASPAAEAMRTASGFDAFNNLSRSSWQATFNVQTGRVKHLYGDRSKAYGDTPENSAREFLKDTHMLFGIQSDLSDLATGAVSQTSDRRHIRFQQTVDGVAVQGARITVHSDVQGRVTMVRSSLRDGIAIANRNILTTDEATTAAVADVQGRFGPGAFYSNPLAEQRIIRHQGTYVYIWKITIPTKTPPGFWVYHVDAESGDILYRADETFYMKHGSGRAYLSNDQWWLGKIKNVKLEDLYETKDMKLQGLLHGQRTTIYEYSDSCSEEEADEFPEKCEKLDGYNSAYAPNLRFRYFPDITEENYPYSDSKSWFDQAAAYYYHTAVWQWWKKEVIKKFGPSDIDYFYWLSVPAAVNVGIWDDEGNSAFCNAFYHPMMPFNPEADDLPGFAYSDDGSCCPKGFGNEDLVNDNDIVRHEYAHAIMDWAGFAGDSGQFGGEVDGYGRAMGEGNSDWYAFLASNKPDIGYVSFPPYGLRTLDNAKRYPDDVDYPDWGVPQEHYTGEIWGGYLYDLSRVLKKKAVGFVYPASFYFSSADGHRDGYADFVDAIKAQRDAEFDETERNRQFLKAFGSMVSRGFIRPLADLYEHESNYFGTGAPGSDVRDYLYLSAPLKLKTPANLLNTGDLHEYPIEAQAGMILDARVSSGKLGMRAPSIELYTIGGVLLAAIDYGTNTKIKKARLTHPIPADGMYVVRVTGISEPRRGYYNMQLRVQ